MTPDRVALLDRVQSFDIDGPGPVVLPFAARLARENGWSRSYADRVVREYKRYVFLAATAAEPVCPSEDVDAAWHLHLTYTRSYWKRFCGEVLGTPLHHEPTKGGPAEAAKHVRMYDGTLAAYRAAFGTDPPADIWPPTAVRFGADLRHRVVNTARHWVIPKWPVKQVLGATAAFVVLATVAPGCAGGGLNPFDLVGAEFLAFLIPMMIGAVCVGRVVRSTMRKPDPQPGDDSLTLSWEQTAFLAGGYPRLVTAAIARLVESGAAALSADKNQLVRGPGIPVGGLSPVESAVYNLLPFGKTRADLKPVQDAVEARFSTVAEQLEADGLFLSKSRQAKIVLASLVPLALVFLFLAFPRLIAGAVNGKPVGYLALTMFGGLAGLIAILVGEWRLTRRGENLLVWKQSQNAALKNGGGSAGSAGMAVALFGMAAFTGLGLEELRQWFPQPTSGSSGGCGSGCGTGGGCGGDGGCGGCGGGD